MKVHVNCMSIKTHFEEEAKGNSEMAYSQPYFLENY